MGYGIIPNMKDESLVCQKPCTHRDCAASREDFIDHNICTICGKELKNGDAFYYQGGGKFRYDKVHAHCMIEQVEQS